jgi:hypothetical protein
MQIIDEYLDTVEANAQTTDPNYYEIEEAYKKLYAAVKELCDNQRIIVSVQNSQNVRYKDYVPCKHCEGWGCSVCCSSQQEIMSRQGTFG